MEPFVLMHRIFRLFRFLYASRVLYVCVNPRHMMYFSELSTQIYLIR